MRPLDLASALALLDAARAAGVTPCWQLSLRAHDGDRWHAYDLAGGQLTYSAEEARCTVATRFDLASVTKALVALCALRCASRGELDLDAPLRALWPRAEGSPSSEATLRALLSHRAELPAWRPFFREVTVLEAEKGLGRDVVLDACLSSVLEPNGRTARYSDVGYLLAGASVESALGLRLDALVARELTAPLALPPEDGPSYRPARRAAPDAAFAPTEECSWRETLVWGSVHDENAYAAGGIAGHAGLFGTARGLAELGRACLESLERGSAWMPRETLRAMTEPLPGGTHRLGFDGRSPEGSSAGSAASAGTFGHLGFTGTSLWCDPEARVAVALLTNRVHPTRERAGIKALRVAVHDALFEALARAR